MSRPVPMRRAVGAKPYLLPAPTAAASSPRNAAAIGDTGNTVPGPFSRLFPPEPLVGLVPLHSVPWAQASPENWR